MDRYGIFVIEKNGPPLLPHAAQALMDVGCQMVAARQGELIVDFSDMCGKVATQFALGCMHAIHGMVFTADLFTSGGQLKLRFMIPVGDLIPKELNQQWQEHNELAEMLSHATDHGYN